MGWRGAHREDEGGTMSDISRRNLLKGAAVSAVAISAMGLLGACAAPSEPKAETTTDPSADGTGTGSGTNSEYMAEVLEPTSMPDASTASNFNIIYDSKTTVGTTYENLMTAIAGETGATTKYEAFSKVAKNEGFDVLARLFQCTADAEKIHIGLEYDLAKEIDPATEKPEPPAVEEHESDINLISGANGEIYETSDMYPSFIKKAQEEGNNKAVQVFTRAKLAEAYHAKLYMDAYTTIDTPFDGKYYLCPICGYIHKGENFDWSDFPPSRLSAAREPRAARCARTSRLSGADASPSAACGLRDCPRFARTSVSRETLVVMPCDKRTNVSRETSLGLPS